jgi:hypothetical protein
LWIKLLWLLRKSRHGPQPQVALPVEQHPLADLFLVDLLFQKEESKRRRMKKKSSALTIHSTKKRLKILVKTMKRTTRKSTVLRANDRLGEAYHRKERRLPEKSRPAGEVDLRRTMMTTMIDHRNVNPEAESLLPVVAHRRRNVTVAQQEVDADR